MISTEFIRTSISLPIETVQKLNFNSFGFIKPNDLACFCLKKFIRKWKINKINQRATCMYNDQACDALLQIWLHPKEHHQLKMYRVLTGFSISFLFFLAIERYLGAIVRGIKRVFSSCWRMEYAEWYYLLKGTLMGIHRKVKFNAKHGCSFLGVLIVMSKPGPKWPLRFKKRTENSDKWKNYVQ